MSLLSVLTINIVEGAQGGLGYVVSYRFLVITFVCCVDLTHVAYHMIVACMLRVLLSDSSWNPCVSLRFLIP